MSRAAHRVRRTFRHWRMPRAGLLRWTLLVSALGHSVGLFLLRHAPAPLPDPVPFQVERWRVALADDDEATVPRPAPAEHVPATAPEAPPPPDTVRISARDQAERPSERRSPAVMPKGPPAQAQRDGPRPGGHRTALEAPGTRRTVRGGLEAGDEALAQGRRGGGGATGDAVHGRPPALGTDAGASSRRGRRTAGPFAHRGHPLPVGRSPRPSWTPLAVRWSPAAAPSGRADRGEDVRGDAPTAHATPVDRPRHAPRPVPEPEPRPPSPPPGPPAPRPGAERHRVAPPTGDPIEELREALGFGVLTSGDLAPRPAQPGTTDGDGAPSRSARPPVDRPATYLPSEAARGTPLGRWVEDAEARIVARWKGLDLSAADRARGIQGDVTILYQVRPNGRVVAVEVDRSSGNPELDAMAVGAVPERLPRLPRETGPGGLVHRVTLRYSNPHLGIVSPL